MKLTTCLSALAVAGLLAGCSQSRPPLANSIADGEELPILGEHEGRSSLVQRPLRVVVYDRALLSQLPVNLPEVDFNEQMVLFAAMGPAPSDACRIRIQRVWRDGQRLRVEVQSEYPDADAPRRRRMNSPIHAVVVPRWEGPIDRFSSQLPRRALQQLSE